MRETKALPRKNYMDKQVHITFTMRAILVNWMAEMAEDFKLSSQTLFLATSYVDRFLSLMMVEKTKLQLVGTAAMFIAAKYEEIHPPTVYEFAFITDDTYTKKQVLRMEDLILKVLRFNVSSPTIQDFLDVYCGMINMDDTTVHLAHYFAELSLLDGEVFLKFAPSKLAAGCVVLARHTLGKEALSDDTLARMGYSREDLKDCVKGLYEAFVNAPSLDQQAIQEKYTDEKFSNVAQLSPVNIV